jgi:hypothetical protein
MAIVSLGHPPGNRARTDIPQPGYTRWGVRRSSWVAAARAFASSRRVNMLSPRRAPPSRHFCSLPPEATTMRACTLWTWLLVNPWIKSDSFGNTDDISVPVDGDRCWCSGSPAEDDPLGTCRGEPTSPVRAQQRLCRLLETRDPDDGAGLPRYSNSGSCQRNSLAGAHVAACCINPPATRM